MITFKVEAAIDLDENRKIWITGKGQADPAEVDIIALIDGATKSVTEQALHTYEQVSPRPGVVPTDGDRAADTALLRGEGKEIDPTRTFGDPD